MIACSAFCLAGAAYANGIDDSHPPTRGEAPIALLVDVTNGQVLHQRNPDRRFVPASITKVMTLFTAFELIEQGSLKRDRIMTMRRKSWQEWHRKGSRMFLPYDAEVPVDVLLTAISTVSANDGSIMLAEGAAGSLDAWLELMNQNARKLGMANSHFGTPNGWPDEGRTFTTARDLVNLGIALVRDHPKHYAHYFGRREFRYNNITQRNYDPISGDLRGADGVKTGYTNEAGFGFLGSAERDGQRLMMVVAGADRGSTRNRASRRYIEWGFGAFTLKPLFGENEQIVEARVQNGSSRTVGLYAKGPVAVNVPKNQDRGIRLVINYDGPVPAPIKAGERVATLRVHVEGMEHPAIIPLYARDNVSKANVFERVANGIMGWFS